MIRIARFVAHKRYKYINNPQPHFAKRWQTTVAEAQSKEIRAARVGFLGFALYQAGYQAGLITYAQDPHKIGKEMMKGVVAASGAKGYHPVHHPYHIQVKRVGERLIFAAKDMCKEKIELLEKELLELESEIARNNQNTKTKEAAAKSRHQNFDLRERVFQINQELEVWRTALSRLKGAWHYVVVDVSSVNAFVTAACPRNIFVHSGLIEKLSPTDDELSLVMGHEISHFLLQHVEKEQTLDVTFKILQLILLTFVEPVGFFSLGYDYLVGKVAQYLDAAYSRECEEEADSLGMELAARACFDTRKSIAVFEKLNEIMHGGSLPRISLPEPVSAELKEGNSTTSTPHQHKNESEKEHASWLDSHPSWDDRIDNINKLAEKFNSQNYRTCQSYLKFYIDSLAGSWN